MRSVCNYLKDIKKGREDWTINVRVTRLWESLKVTSNSELMSLDMVLLDEKGDYMHASIWKGFISKFQSLLEEGKVYRISRFRVVDNKKTHKVVSGDCMINFVPSTFVMDLSDESHKIGNHVFEIVDFDTARSRLGRNIELSDVVGRFTGLSSIQDQLAFGSMVKTRVLGLQDIREDKIEVTLWGPHTSKISLPDAHAKDEPVVFTVTSTTVKTFRGKIYLSTTPATKIYSNLSIPESNELLQSAIDRKITVEEIILGASGKAVVPERKLLQEIIRLRSDNDSEKITVECQAKIIDIDNTDGWFYLSCNQCPKKATKLANTFWCDACKIEPQSLKKRYRLKVEVQDGSTSSTFVIFDRIAERLIELPASQLSNCASLDTNDIAIPSILKGIIGKTFLFHLKLDTYNLQKGWQNYTVSNILNVASDDSNTLPDGFEVEGSTVNGKRKYSCIAPDQEIEGKGKEKMGQEEEHE